MEKRSAPNLVWILSDQHRFCDTGYAGNSEVETSNLDWLSTAGAEFEAAYSNCPLCVPARGCLWTGLHALRHGAAANDLPIRPECESIATVLDKAGYHTAYFGKWHLGGPPRDAFISHYNRLGFQYWNANNCNHDYLHGYYDDNNNIRHPIEGYAPAGETELVLEYLEKAHKKQEPFAVFLNFGIPHDPYFALPEGELERYQKKKLTLRGNCEKKLLQGERGMDAYKPERYYAGYYAHIRQLDLQIGRILDELKKLEELGNTIVVYTSDHGDMLGSHGYLNKQMYFEESSHVPLLISWPGHIPGGKRETAVGLVDLAPTVLGLLGLRFEGQTDGEDLSDVVLGREPERERFVYLYSYVPCHQAAARRISSWRAITDGRWMLAVDQKRTVLGLYHTREDPLQMRDLQLEEAYAPKKQELLEKLDEEVHSHDGYVDWKILLCQHGLDSLWDESEAFFSKYFSKFYTNLKKTGKG